MAAELDGQTSEAEEALAGGAPQRVGLFRFYFADQRWEWSEQVQRLHGYQPGTVRPITSWSSRTSTPTIAGKWRRPLRKSSRHRPFSTRHRILDTEGKVNHVVVVGDQLRDDSGVVIGTHGFYVDVTPVPHTAREDIITAKVAEIAERRARMSRSKAC